MQTYSHTLINGVRARSLKRRGWDVNTPAFVPGGILPDIPFFLMAIIGGIYYTMIGGTPSGEPPMVYMHMTLYFRHPWWISAHNLLHAPFSLVVLSGIGFVAIHNGQTWGGFLFWFAMGAGLHTLIDVFTHAGDGPLLLFPFNWSYRFQSPVSYWDPAHYGLIFAPLEHVLVIVLIAVLVKRAHRARQRRNRSGYTFAPCWLLHSSVLEFRTDNRHPRS